MLELFGNDSGQSPVPGSEARSISGLLSHDGLRGSDPGLIGTSFSQLRKIDPRAALRSNRQFAAPHRIPGLCRLFPASPAFFPKQLVWQTPGLTVPWQVADTSESVRQGTTDPRQGNKSHLLRFSQRALNLLSACISGSQALMKGDCHDIEASSSSLPGIPA